MSAGLSETSASLNEGGRGTGSEAKRPWWRGAARGLSPAQLHDAASPWGASGATER